MEDSSEIEHEFSMYNAYSQTTHPHSHSGSYVKCEVSTYLLCDPEGLNSGVLLKNGQYKGLLKARREAWAGERAQWIMALAMQN